MKRYSTTDIVMRTGASARQLALWAGQGWLSDAGESWEWTENDLFRTQLIMRLLRAGLTIERAGPIARRIVACDLLSPIETIRVHIGEGIQLVIKDIHGPQDMGEIPLVKLQPSIDMTKEAK